MIECQTAVGGGCEFIWDEHICKTSHKNFCEWLKTESDCEDAKKKGKNCSWDNDNRQCRQDDKLSSVKLTKLKGELANYDDLMMKGEETIREIRIKRVWKKMIAYVPHLLEGVKDWLNVDLCGFVQDQVQCGL